MRWLNGHRERALGSELAGVDFDAFAAGRPFLEDMRNEGDRPVTGWEPEESRQEQSRIAEGRVCGKAQMIARERAADGEDIDIAERQRGRSAAPPLPQMSFQRPAVRRHSQSSLNMVPTPRSTGP